jgi:hypothetical protein
MVVFMKLVSATRRRWFTLEYTLVEGRCEPRSHFAAHPRHAPRLAVIVACVDHLHDVATHPAARHAVRYAHAEYVFFLFSSFLGIIADTVADKDTVANDGVDARCPSCRG